MASQLSLLGWVLALWLVGGAANAIGSIAQETLLQQTTPDRVRGRVFAAADALTDGSILLGALAGGILGALIGVRGALAACAIMLLLAAVAARFILSGRTDSAARAAPALPSRSQAADPAVDGALS